MLKKHAQVRDAPGRPQPLFRFSYSFLYGSLFDSYFSYLAHFRITRIIIKAKNNNSFINNKFNNMRIDPEHLEGFWNKFIICLVIGLWLLVSCNRK